MSLIPPLLSLHGRCRLQPPSSLLDPSAPIAIADRYDDDVDIQKKTRHPRRVSSTTGRFRQYGPLTLQRRNGLEVLTAPSPRYISPSPSLMGDMVVRRQYHATLRKEILPFLAAGVLGASTVYTYRALQQMDRDWEEYYDALEEYKAATGINSEKYHNESGDLANAADAAAAAASAASTTKNKEDMSRFFSGGTLAIDVGTSRLKLSHISSLANESHKKNGKYPSPIVIVDREGFRSTPSIVWMPPFGDGDEILIGRLVGSRSYDTQGGTIVLPREALMNDDGGWTAKRESAIQQTIRAVATNALDQILGSGGSAAKIQNPLFVLDASMAMEGSYNVRPIFTYPTPGNATDRRKLVERYQHAIDDLTFPAGIAAFVPEPVAIVCGAEHYNLLPSKEVSSGNSVLVVDVGGTSTCFSIVGGGDKVMHTTELPFGGETFIDVLVSYLVEDSFGPSKDNAGGVSETAPSPRPKLNDPMALQRLYEASTTATHELSKKTRSEINVPYLTMDLKTRQPKHLQVGMARSVVESEVESWVRKNLVPCLRNTDHTALSQALPPPTSLSSLFSSSIMSLLERTSHTPHMLRAVLVVGGGARIPSVRRAIKEGVGYLAGDTYANDKRLVMPGGEMGEELGVLGAAVWGSGGI